MKKYLLGLGILVFGFLLTANITLAASVGPNSAGSGVNTTGFGSTAWSNPSYITSVGSPYATVTLTPGTSSNYLKATNYGLNIPASAIIDGIEVKIDRKGEQNLGFGFQDDVVKLVKGGVVGGNNKASTNTYPTSLSIKTYGASNDKWGLSWTPADINASNFGVVLSTKSNLIISTKTASINDIQIIVHYTLTTGSLNVTKTTIGGDGTFAFTGTGLVDFNITTLLNTGFNLISNLIPGNYTVNETAQTGWDITSNNCSNISVTIGNTSNCTIVNTKRGSITINKNVLKPDGINEASDNNTFSVMLDNANTQNISENSSYTYTNLIPGTYTITENSDSNYEFVSFSNDADLGTTGAQIVVTAGSNAVLTITNKQKPVTLTINKIVTNPNGGEAIATDFSFQVNGGEVTSFIDSPDENPLTGQNIISVDPGTYNITEVTPEGAYAISYSEACTNAVLTSNTSATCTITNSDIPEGKGAITVRKIVNNMYAGTLTVNDFDLFISEGETSTEVVSGQSNFLNPGTYTISEGALPSGYMKSSLVCSSNGDEPTSGTVVLTEQDSWVCTITNNDKPAKLTIIKKVINNAWNADVTETFNFNLTGEEDISISTEVPEGEFNSEEYNAIGQSGVMNLSAGNYVLTENLLPEWNLTNISCSNEEGMEIENGVSLSLSNGEEVTCTFINTRKTGTLIIEKVVSNDDGKELTISDFPGFTINSSEPIPFIEDMGEGAEGLTGGKTLIMQRGVYSVSEPITEGYFKIPENCSAINIDENETETCKLINEDIGFFVHSGGSTGGSVLGASTETPEPVTETPAEAPKGEVLGATTCSAIYLNDFLYFGKKNNPEQVKLLQTFLNEELGLKLVVDGKYGKTTRNAVITFQEKYGTDILTPWAPFGLKSGKGTGNVYKTTKWKINMIKCADLKLEVPQLP